MNSMVDSKSKALEIHMNMNTKNGLLPFTERLKQSKIDSIDYAERKLNNLIKLDDKLYWKMVIKYLNKI